MVITAVYGADLEEAYDASCMEQRIPGTHRMQMQIRMIFFFFKQSISCFHSEIAPTTSIKTGDFLLM